MKILPKDTQILSALRKNARASLTKISRETKIPVSTIFERLKNFQKVAIHKYTTLVDFKRFGFTTKAFVILKFDKADKEIAFSILQKSIPINSSYKVNNGYDILLECIFKDIRELEEFFEEFEKKVRIKAKQIFHVIEDLKQQEFLANPEHLKITSELKEKLG